MHLSKSTLERIGRTPHVSAAICCAVLLAAAAPSHYPAATIAGVTFESDADATEFVIRLVASDEIPWHVLETPASSTELRLTLLNTGLEPGVETPAAAGPLRSIRLLQQGSKVVLEATLAAPNLTVALRKDPDGFDLLLAIENRPAALRVVDLLRSASRETALETAPRQAEATPTGETLTVRAAPPLHKVAVDAPAPLPGGARVFGSAASSDKESASSGSVSDVERLFGALESAGATHLPDETAVLAVAGSSGIADSTRADDLGPADQRKTPGESGLPGQTRWKLDTIVIDAGHGGWDEGAFGQAGFLEKEIALIIALRVGRLIEQHLGIRVVYTRTDDRFIPVAERSRVANEAGGKLFLSIHANYSDNSQAHGTETYFLGVHRSDSARVVMERENRVIRLEEDQDHYKQYENAANAQQALARSSFMRHGEVLAESIQAQFTAVVKRRDRGVKQAGFYVLFGALMPSVLIELGFLSNPQEEKFLSTTDGQASMANAIFRAVQDFKFEYERSVRVASE